MAIRGHAQDSGDHCIDLAPLLDFVLNLLIFFIITTSFVKQTGAIIDRPFAETAEHKESGNLLIGVKPNGQIWMDRKQVDLRELRPAIEKLHIERPEDTIVIIADKLAPAGQVAKVMDEARKAGIKDIVISAQLNP
ncbi:MAG: biopolymer transporter ExbD [Proteobacteria bacterium]|nr:biopolymer transporter ExbD [Pseudomonadota bacterium]